jgi:methylated-DNA-[protein]-cysteine S-methyltransferase
VRFELTCNENVEFDGFAEQSRTDSLLRIWPRATARGERPSPSESNPPSPPFLLLPSSRAGISLGGVTASYPLPFLSCLQANFQNRTGSTIFTTTLDSPVGTLHLAATDAALLAVVWRRHSTPQLPFSEASESPGHPVLRETIRQLGEYFNGKRQSFDLPLEFRGTDFQRRVWTTLLEIPFGETRSYLDVARSLGNPDAVRAVGAANGRNPISIIAPCHRVIGSSGDLTGFGGGLEAKAWLLAHEAPQRDLLAAM